MPKCEVCQGSYPSTSLKKRGVYDVVTCPNCQEPKGRDTMAETKSERVGKKVMSLHIYEISTPDGGRDHEVEVEGSWGGAEVKFKTTIDKVREFFTKRRVEGHKAPLEVVK